MKEIPKEATTAMEQQQSRRNNMSIEIEHRTSNHIITKMQHGNAPQMMENLKGLNSALFGEDKKDEITV